MLLIQLPDNLIVLSPNQLENYFQLIHKNAHKYADEVQSRIPEAFNRTVDREMDADLLSVSSNIPRSGPLFVGSEDDELEVVERFVLKAGTLCTRSDILAGGSGVHVSHLLRLIDVVSQRYFTLHNASPIMNTEIIYWKRCPYRSKYGQEVFPHSGHRNKRVHVRQPWS